LLHFSVVLLFDLFIYHPHLALLVKEVHAVSYEYIQRVASNQVNWRIVGNERHDADLEILADLIDLLPSLQKFRLGDHTTGSASWNRHHCVQLFVSLCGHPNLSHLDVSLDQLNLQEILLLLPNLRVDHRPRSLTLHQCPNPSKDVKPLMFHPLISSSITSLQLEQTPSFLLFHHEVDPHWFPVDVWSTLRKLTLFWLDRLTLLAVFASLNAYVRSRSTPPSLIHLSIDLVNIKVEDLEYILDSLKDLPDLSLLALVNLPPVMEVDSFFGKLADEVPELCKLLLWFQACPSDLEACAVRPVREWDDDAPLLGKSLSLLTQLEAFSFAYRDRNMLSDSEAIILAKLNPKLKRIGLSGTKLDFNNKHYHITRDQKGVIKVIKRHNIDDGWSRRIVLNW